MSMGEAARLGRAALYLTPRKFVLNFLDLRKFISKMARFASRF
jgi:hypothetical protein